SGDVRQRAGHVLGGYGLDEHVCQAHHVAAGGLVGDAADELEELGRVDDRVGGSRSPRSVSPGQPSPAGNHCRAARRPPRPATPPADSAASRLRVDVWKNSSAAAPSKEGEFDTSTTTEAPSRAAASPWPVTMLTPEAGDAASVLYPRSRSLVTSFDPISPLPPMTTIFMMSPLCERSRDPRSFGFSNECRR